VAAGRCAGCGKTGSACHVSAHIIDCGDWLALYASDPARALDAEAEHERWKADDQQTERDVRREAKTEAGEAARTASLGRFRYVNPLGDDE
jgi:hypothetical protein